MGVEGSVIAVLALDMSSLMVSIVEGMSRTLLLILL